MKNLGRVDHPGLAIANQKLLEGSTSDDFKIGGQESRSQTKVKSKPKAVKQRLFVRTKKFGDLGPLKARSYKTTASGHKMTRRGGSSGRPRLDLKGLISHMKEQSGAVAPPNVSMDDQSDCGPVSPKKQSVMSAAEVRINQLYVKNGKLKRGRPRKYPVQGLLQSPSGVSRSGRKLNPTPKMTSSQENFRLKYYVIISTVQWVVRFSLHLATPTAAQNQNFWDRQNSAMEPSLSAMKNFMQEADQKRINCLTWRLKSPQRWHQQLVLSNPQLYGILLTRWLNWPVRILQPMSAAGKKHPKSLVLIFLFGRMNHRLSQRDRHRPTLIQLLTSINSWVIQVWKIHPKFIRFFLLCHPVSLCLCPQKRHHWNSLQ